MLTHLWTILLMFWYNKGIKPACRPNIEGSEFITNYLIHNVGFHISSYWFFRDTLKKIKNNWILTKMITKFNIKNWANLPKILDKNKWTFSKEAKFINFLFVVIDYSEVLVAESLKLILNLILLLLFEFSDIAEGIFPGFSLRTLSLYFWMFDNHMPIVRYKDWSQNSFFRYRSASSTKLVSSVQFVLGYQSWVLSCSLVRTSWRRNHPATFQFYIWSVWTFLSIDWRAEFLEAVWGIGGFVLNDVREEKNIIHLYENWYW